MLSILIRSAIITAGAVVASLALTFGSVTAAGGTVGHIAVLMCVVCPLVTAWPVSALMLRQGDRLKVAHRDLAQAHAQLVLAHRQLADKARHDDLTGLLNRDSFLAVLEGSRHRPDRGALLLIDADHFKTINDTFGHPAGDEALRLIAAAIRRGVRAADAVGRIGGEEFCAFLAGAGEQEARRIAERIRAEVETVRFRPPGERAVALTVSIGGTLCRQGAAVAEMMRDADGRLYEAKRGGRNTVVVVDVPKAA